MSQTNSISLPSVVDGLQTNLTVRLATRLFKGFDGGAMLRLWNDHLIKLGRGVPTFTLVLREPRVLYQFVTARNPVMLADAYFRRQIDVEGDLYGALALKNYFESLTLKWHEKLSLVFTGLRLALCARLHGRTALTAVTGEVAQASHYLHTRSSDRDAIAFHYDVSNAFYGLWLDSQRVYSCGYFETQDDTLDEAQRNKLDHICRKLRLKPGERFLDIGCGWGALLSWAATHYGVFAHGITLSQQQFDFVRQRIVDEGLEGRVSVELRDYRDLPAVATYDKVASIGMFEHVGLDRLTEYHRAVLSVLRPGGLFLNHGITHDEEGWNQTVATEFINRYVFPDGELDCVSNIQLNMERVGLEIEDVEALRRHYALTLRHWVKRLEANREAALEEVGEVSYRIWRFYMAACALEFEQGGTGIYQILASRRGDNAQLPLTRKDIYVSPAAIETAASSISLKSSQ